MSGSGSFSFNFKPVALFDRCNHEQCRQLYNPALPTPWNRSGFCSRECSIDHHAKLAHEDANKKSIWVNSFASRFKQKTKAPLKDCIEYARILIKESGGECLESKGSEYADGLSKVIELSDSNEFVLINKNN